MTLTSCRDTIGKAPHLLRRENQHGLRVPSVLKCTVLIFGLKVALRAAGLFKVTGWIRRQVQSVPMGHTEDAEIVALFERAVATAGALYPGRALCLEQSLVLYYLLRRAGIPVRYCQGVQPYPFLAHAWVEYEGYAINDVGEHVEHFARLSDQLP